ncbi:pyridoxamine 5'-phosphate oxidase family protein [Microbacterium sp. LMI12-1-1.1]|uniref:pyridoxamine 5'-phosphate oxidase family protein n=1 Tax=Microbacterium sp. LMI12-1-1.1 TaxID=3135225 RepID=UPI003448DF20
MVGNEPPVIDPRAPGHARHVQPPADGPEGPGSGVPNPYLASRPEELASGAEKVEHLEAAHCWRLLETTQIGRLAIEGRDGRPDVFPVNYLVHDGSVFIRSAPGSKLRSIAKHPSVAFEIDGETASAHWSVVVHADAHRMDTDADIEASGVLELASNSPTEKDDFIRLVPESVSGRSFPR